MIHFLGLNPFLSGQQSKLMQRRAYDSDQISLNPFLSGQQSKRRKVVVAIGSFCVLIPFYQVNNLNRPQVRILLRTWNRLNPFLSGQQSKL